MRMEEETQRRDYELAKLGGHIQQFKKEFNDSDSVGLLETLLKIYIEGWKVKI